MKRLKAIIIFVSIVSMLLATVQSCSITANTAVQNEGIFSHKGKLEIRKTTFQIIQTLGKHEGLAMDSNYDVVKIIKNDEIIYDNKKLCEKWVLVDTYTYPTVKEQVKTVPVFIPYREYKEAIRNGHHFSIYD